MRRYKLIQRRIRFVMKRNFKAFILYIRGVDYEYKVLKEDEYFERFGIVMEDHKYKVIDGEKLKAAYSKAWENRNFEIDKFWSRAAYFWGFIVFIFGGYATLITVEPENVTSEFINLELYALLLGFLFSVSWYLVIRGSKCWQENWENHIDFLEDYVSGPIYKTLFIRKKRFYSVSKLNETMALIVVFVGGGLLAQFSMDHYVFSLGKDFQIVPTISFLLTVFFVCVLRFGYCSGSYYTRKKGFIDRYQDKVPIKKSLLKRIIS